MLADTQRFCPRRPLSGCGPAQHGCGQHALFGQRPFRGVFAARHAEQLCRVTEGVPARRRGRWFLVEGARVPAVEGVLAWRREHGFPQGAPGLVPVSVASPNSCSRGYRKPATAMAPDGQGLALRLVLVGAPRQQEACHWGPCTFAAHVLCGRRPSLRAGRCRGGGLRAGAQTEPFLPRPHLRPVLSGKLTTQTRLILAWTTSATSSRWDDPA